MLKRIVCPACTQWNEITALNCRVCGSPFGLEPVYISIDEKSSQPVKSVEAGRGMSNVFPMGGTGAGIYLVGSTSGNGIAAIGNGSGNGISFKGR